MTRPLVLAALLVPLAACDTGTPAPPVDPLDDVLIATTRYHDVDRALADGWAPASPCVESPAGGMGYHYVNGALMDNALDPRTPEALLYEPQADNSLQLVGVEYIVPFALAPADGPAPVLFGEAFHPNGEQGFWALHVWVWQDNPSGTFADFNPMVTCDHAR